MRVAHIFIINEKYVHHKIHSWTLCRVGAAQESRQRRSGRLTDTWRNYDGAYVFTRSHTLRWHILNGCPHAPLLRFMRVVDIYIAVGVSEKFRCTFVD